MKALIDEATVKLALEALENSVDLVSQEARNAEELYGKCPTRLARIQGLVAFEVAHEKAITALKALADQPAQQQSCYCLNCESLSKQLTALKTCLEVERGFHAQEQPAQQEPFGYFKAEPFGWTDCAETDEGAVALYTTPQPAQQGPVAELLMQSKQNFERNFGSNGYADWIYKDLSELLEASPQPAQQEPAAIVAVDGIGQIQIGWIKKPQHNEKLFTSPPAQRTWVEVKQVKWEGEKLIAKLKEST